MPSVWQILAIPVLIAMNAFFVTAEYALVAIRPVQIEQLRRSGRRRSAAAMARLKEEPASAIGAIQVCITMTNLMLGWIGEPAMSRLLEALFGGVLGRVLPERVFFALSAGLSFLIVTLLTVVFSELLPKALTLRYTMPLTVLTARPVLAIRTLIRPLVALMNAMANLVTRPLGLGSVEQMEKEFHSVEEIRLIASEAADTGALTARERSLILNSLALGRRSVRQIMIPRVHVRYLDLRRSMEENLAVIADHLHSRMPLCDGSMDRVVGVIYTKEFLVAYHERADVSVLSLIARPAIFAPQTLSLDRMLAVFHDNRTHVAFLVDEFGAVVGMVTLADVVDELVGEIVDADEVVVAPLQPETSGSFIVKGELPLHELAAMLSREGLFADRSVSTVGGLVSAELGHIPSAGEQVMIEGIRFRVLESDKRTVRRVQITPPRNPA